MVAGNNPRLIFWPSSILCSILLKTRHFAKNAFSPIKSSKQIKALKTNGFKCSMLELLGGFEPPTSSYQVFSSLFFAVVLFCSLFCVSVAALCVHGLSLVRFHYLPGAFVCLFRVLVCLLVVSFIASRKICEARRRLSSLAWLYIRKVTAVSLWPRVSDTLTTIRPACYGNAGEGMAQLVRVETLNAVLLGELAEVMRGAGRVHRLPRCCPE